ncbi:MAG: Rrf2 family transcriptional regulator [Lachnospiraceae bacterium]|nr:Rrf2 family transcriptional regulator [Lachnospiraceae bacterium]MDD3796877.1 Rrf2 family transcriptional regulator [Lachnospiraceae bacterium]
MTAEFSLAVHGLVFLLHKDTIVTSDELAANICTNSARVRKVMARLKHFGLVRSSEGKGSGYHCIDHSEAITLRQVLNALEETAVSTNWRSGSVDMDCQIASGMGAVMDDIYENMNLKCEAYLESVTIGMIQDRIFQR